MAYRSVSYFTLPTVLLSLVTSAQAHAEEPFASGNFRSACALAGKTRRIVLVDFYTTWCGPCKKLDETTWKNKMVRAWLTKTAVSRKIDAEKETALATKYKVNAYPTILLLKSDGTEIDRLVGYREPKEFLTEAKLALAGQDSIARAKAKLKGTGMNDPSERMSYADTLAEKGRYSEALKEYLWCFDEGNKYGPGFYGVRLSFLLSRMQQLGTEYPPAVTALKQRRDAARARLEAGGNGAFNAAMDFASLNEHLDQQDDTLVEYDRLKAKNVTAAAAMLRSISDLLLEKQRYADFLQGVKNVSSFVDEKITTYKLVGNDARIDKEAKDYLKQSVIKEVGGLYEALAGTDRLTEADIVRDKLLAFAPGVATYAELVRHAIRAGKQEVADKLKSDAKAALSPADFEKLERSPL